MTKPKKGFSAFDLAAEVNSAPPVEEKPESASKPAPKPKPAKQKRVQRAIYFPEDVDDDLQRWGYEDRTQITKIVVQAVREYGERRSKKQ